MEAVALFAETQIKFLILGALVIQETVDGIDRGVGAPFSQPGPARARVMSSVAESAEFRPGF
jgi:hypothetical protein